MTTLADLVVAKSHTGAAMIGSDLEFTLAVSNLGPSEARSVTMVDTLPAGLTYVSAVGADWTCAAVDQVVTCELGAPLAPLADAAPIALTVAVGPESYPAAQNVVVGSTATPEVTTDNNTAKDVVDVPPLVDLALDKSHTGDFTVGQEGTYTLTLTNNGPTSDPGPQTITDTLPAGLTYVEAAGDGLGVHGGRAGRHMHARRGTGGGRDYLGRAHRAASGPPRTLRGQRRLGRHARRRRRRRRTTRTTDADGRDARCRPHDQQGGARHRR